MKMPFAARAFLRPKIPTLPPNAKVVVGMSGGVDSSVTAMLLKQQGFNVEGWYMRNWDSYDEEGECRGEDDYKDVQRVCSQLDIPCHKKDYVKEYWNDVFSALLTGYESGVTPNPDLLCNREIKFNTFLKDALASGAAAIATGHYARTAGVSDSPPSYLLKGIDPLKDQSYFLAAVPQSAIQHVLFPIGDRTKVEVRQMAVAAGLVTANKKNSVGICFIGKRKFDSFLERYLIGHPGQFVSIVDGSVVGSHNGTCFYTIGQGARIGGAQTRWFVVAKDLNQHILFVAPSHEHPSMFFKSLRAHKSSWFFPTINAILHQEGLRCQAQIRHLDPPSDCVVKIDPITSLLDVQFSSPQRAIAPGQAVVFYDQEMVLGSSEVHSAGPSLYHDHLSQTRALCNIVP